MKKVDIDVLTKGGRLASKIYLITLFNKMSNSEISGIIYDREEPCLAKILKSRDVLIKAGYSKLIIYTDEAKSIDKMRKYGSKYGIKNIVIIKDCEDNTFHGNTLFIESNMKPFYEYAKNNAKIEFSEEERNILYIFFNKFSKRFHRQIKLVLNKYRLNPMHLLASFFYYLIVHNFNFAEDDEYMNELFPKEGFSDRTEKIILKLADSIEKVYNTHYDENKFIVEFAYDLKWNFPSHVA
jgi:hypothetical protein